MTSEELDNIRAKWSATGRPAVAYMGDHETFYAELRDAESWNLVAKVDIDGGGTDEDGRALADAYTDIPRLCDEVARLTSEVERLSAMVPRWVKEGVHHDVWRLRVAGQDVGLTQLEPEPDGRWYEWPACVSHPNLPTACRAVCARLGLPDILPPTENT